MAFDGMTIGVVIPSDATGPEAGRAMANRDAARMAAQSNEVAAAAPECAVDRGSPDTDVGVFLACEGREPDSYFVRLPGPMTPELASGSPGQQVRARLRVLLSPPPEPYRNAGYYSVLAGAPESIQAVTLEGSHLTVSFSDDINHLGVHELAAGTVLVDQVLATALSVDAVQSVQLTLGGDCEAFWAALEGSGCHTLTRDDLQERD